MANFNPNHKIVLDNLLLSHPLVRAGKMFGFPAYYVDRKLCICLYEDGAGMAGLTTAAYLARAGLNSQIRKETKD